MYILAMHWLAAASLPRLSETEPKCFVFETSCYAFGGRIRRFAKVNVNYVNIILLYQFNMQRCSIRGILSIYWQCVYPYSVTADQNELKDAFGLIDTHTNGQTNKQTNQVQLKSRDLLKCIQLYIYRYGIMRSSMLLTYWLYMSRCLGSCRIHWGRSRRSYLEYSYIPARNPMSLRRTRLRLQDEVMMWG